MSDFPRGSEWRRWDLHLHTPLSIIQQFGGSQSWDQYIAAIAALPDDVSAIAVTDYLFCDGYEHLLTRRAEISNIELVFLNIEFRLNTFSGRPGNTKRHNYHVLFDPSVNVEDIREQLLNGLSNGYRIEDGTVWNKTPTRRSLEELGQQIKAAAPRDNSIQNKSDLEAGFDNITYKREEIEKLLEKHCFTGKFVTAIGYSEWENSRWDQSAAEKRDLINSADFSLTAFDDEEVIASHKEDLISNRLNSLILHSSDAHSLDRIGKTKQWIKADPTFAGLKQVLNEPEARTFIGDTPPNFKPDHKVISKITIGQSNGWFEDDFSLELNRDLVTIIGGRGSGKSALAEAIAYGAGSFDESDDAFLKKACNHRDSIEGAEIVLQWADGSTTKFNVGELKSDKGLVQYLPQGAVEALCSHLNSEKLQAQIENVIFQALDETERLGASNFDELKNRILEASSYEEEEVRKMIWSVNSQICSTSLKINTLPDRTEQLERSKAELQTLTQSLPVLSEKDQQGQEELAALLEGKKLFEDKILQLQLDSSKISSIQSKLRILKSQVITFNTEIGSLLLELGVTEVDQNKVALNTSGLDSFVVTRSSEITASLETLKNGTREGVAALLKTDAEKLPADNLTALNAAIDAKEKETRAYETLKLKYQQQKKTAAALESSIKAQQAEIAKIQADAQNELDALIKQRAELVCNYFELLKNEKKQIEKLYEPLQQSLSGGTTTDQLLVFEAKLDYKVEAHARAGLDIIDRSRRGNFREQGTLRKRLLQLWSTIRKNGFSDEKITEEFVDLMTQFENFEGETLEVEDQLRESHTKETFLNWLFDPAYFGVVSSLRFNGTELYLLSPGQKGIILLMLYLKIDTDDYRPLVIDQPEENLDNLSIYTDLINYFRDRKQYRQIIMVTHNPNLVVNTDSEQVVVAHYDGDGQPRLNYSSGSLENQAEMLPDVKVEELTDGIIEKVCNILEGGQDAFSNRRRKYQLSEKNQL